MAHDTSLRAWLYERVTRLCIWECDTSGTAPGCSSTADFSIRKHKALRISSGLFSLLVPNETGTQRGCSVLKQHPWYPPRAVPQGHPPFPALELLNTLTKPRVRATLHNLPGIPGAPGFHC